MQKDAKPFYPIIILYLFLIFQVGCDDLSFNEKCQPGMCHSESKLPETIGGDFLLPGDISTTAGGVVRVVGIQEIKLNGTQSLAGVAKLDRDTLLLLVENLGSSIHRLRVRKWMGDGSLGDPICDLLQDASVSVEQLRIVGSTFFRLQRSYNISVLQQYSLTSCTLEETINFPSNLGNGDYLVVDGALLNVGLKELNIFSLASRVLEGAIAEPIKGGEDLTWSYVKNMTDDGLHLWFRESTTHWRLNRSKHTFDWFKIPVVSYPCLNSIKTTWRQENLLNVVCSAGASFPLQVISFDVSKFDR